MMAREVQETGDKILDDLNDQLRRVRKNIDWSKRRPVRGSYPLMPEEMVVINKIEARKAELSLLVIQPEMSAQQEIST